MGNEILGASLCAHTQRTDGRTVRGAARGSVKTRGGRRPKLCDDVTHSARGDRDRPGSACPVPAHHAPQPPSIAGRQLAFTPAGAPPCDLAVSRAPWRRIEEAPAPGHLRRSAALMVAARLRHRTRLAGACARETRPASSLPRCVAWRGVASGGRQAIPSIRAQQSGGIPQ
jgi:hypothetical protein